ncbi:hypothetical protein BDK92_2423 [Micromonospora pisi]|uniref:Uncharacterized protein n=1 Tax=Micromonospora pisi TaxID=589240 RepID=A0A495JGI8_9ACTN|nr:hypothetical protein [Micromonospora pisi]RKR88116.1 hypothetical protein BDK92_2423 [Micromonospora pisi]
MSKSSTVEPTAEGRRLLRRLVERSKRTGGVQLPPGFLRDDTLSATPPLAHMLRGGQGGEVRLKLYLTMTMLAARPPHDIKSIPARTWARVLALPDPEVNGARRITDALNWLQEARLVRLDSRQGMPKDVTLLSPSGTGKAYSWRGSWYISMPLGFWQNEWVYQLSGSAVGFLLVLRDMRSNKTETDPPWLTMTQKQRYGFSEDTWTRASKELRDHSLLVVRRKPQGKEFDHRRLRNTYWINIERLDRANEPFIPAA